MKSSSAPPWESFKRLFAVDYATVEAAVEDRPGHYKDLDPRALYTDLEDLYHLMQSPWVSGDWVDLGGGVGESALLYGSLFSDRKGISIERDAARVATGLQIKERLKLENVEILKADLLTCELPKAQTYFLYFPTGPVLDRVLSELAAKDDFFRLIVIESHGDLLSRIRKEAWAREVAALPLVSPRHHPEAIVFEHREKSETKGPFALSFKKKFLLIDDHWIGETLGLEWLQEDKYQLLHPPRTIDWAQVTKVLEFEELPRTLQALVTWRRLGELRFRTGEREFLGKIRKIAVTGGFEVEISSGEWVKWKDIRTITTENHLCYDSSSDFYFLPPVQWGP